MGHELLSAMYPLSPKRIVILIAIPSMYRGYLAVPLDLMKTKNLENIDAFEKSNAGFDFS